MDKNYCDGYFKRNIAEAVFPNKSYRVVGILAAEIETLKTNLKNSYYLHT